MERLLKFNQTVLRGGFGSTDQNWRFLFLWCELLLLLFWQVVWVIRVHVTHVVEIKLALFIDVRINWFEHWSRGLLARQSLMISIKVPQCKESVRVFTCRPHIDVAFNALGRKVLILAFV